MNESFKVFLPTLQHSVDTYTLPLSVARMRQRPISRPADVSSPLSMNGSKMKKWESHDYTRMVNTYTRDENLQVYNKIKMPLIGYSGKTLARWSLTWLVGLTMGAIAFCISKTAEELTMYRRKGIQNAISGTNGWQKYSPAYIWLGICGWNWLLAMTACCLVLFVSPQACASGIPEVKAVLNGIHVPRFLSFKTLVAKILGTICTVASGLVLGPEGPLVHIGAIVGSGVTVKPYNIYTKDHTRHMNYPTIYDFPACLFLIPSYSAVGNASRSARRGGANRG